MLPKASNRCTKCNKSPNLVTQYITHMTNNINMLTPHLFRQLITSIALAQIQLLNHALKFFYLASLSIMAKFLIPKKFAQVHVHELYNLHDQINKNVQTIDTSITVTDDQPIPTSVSQLDKNRQTLSTFDVFSSTFERETTTLSYNPVPAPYTQVGRQVDGIERKNTLYLRATLGLR